MPFEAVAQGEGPGELVRRDLPLVDHLRLDRELLVEREQRVVDEIAMVGGDQRRGPDRIDDLEIGMEGDLEGGLGAGGTADDQQGCEKNRDGGSQMTEG